MEEPAFVRLRRTFVHRQTNSCRMVTTEP